MKTHHTAYKLLQLLGDGEFHSGQELGEVLGVTRSAIWKSRKLLAGYGIELYALPRKGYCLPQGIELLNLDAIKRSLLLSTRSDLEDILVLTTTNSTNDYLNSLAPHRSKENIACFAEYQTKGRGRHGRPWVGSFGTNIYLSLLWHFDKDPAEILGLSLVTAIAVVKSLQTYGITDGLQLKWPNDVHWNGKKLAGILIDMSSQPHIKSSVTLGVGINTHLSATDDESIDQPWTDVSKILPTKPQRNRLAGLLLNELVQHIQRFDTEGLTPFLDEWKNYDAMVGKSVLLETPQGSIPGVMKGITDRGELILLTENNQTESYLSGELSLRLA